MDIDISLQRVNVYSIGRVLTNMDVKYDLPLEISHPEKQFLNILLESEPAQRPSATEALLLPYRCPIIIDCNEDIIME